jgi:hypothetical protein
MAKCQQIEVQWFLALLMRNFNVVVNIDRSWRFVASWFASQNALYSIAVTRPCDGPIKIRKNSAQYLYVKSLSIMLMTYILTADSCCSRHITAKAMHSSQSSLHAA